jgi:hypothetical protein
MARQLWETQQQVAQMQEAQAQAQQAQVQQAAVQASQAGETDFLAQYDLSPEQLQVLRQRTIQSGIYQGIAAANSIRGLDGRPIPNHREATRVALEQTFWNTPEFRDQMLALAQQTQTDTALAQHEVDRQRQLRASAVSGGSATPPHQTPAVAPTEEGRRNQMIEDLARAQRGEQVLAEQLSPQ